MRGLLVEESEDKQRGNGRGDHDGDGNDEFADAGPLVSAGRHPYGSGSAEGGLCKVEAIAELGPIEMRAHSHLYAVLAGAGDGTEREDHLLTLSPPK